MMSNSSKSTNSVSAKLAVQPSYVPSISSSLNQSNNLSTNNFNNTQPNPFTVHLDRSRDPSVLHHGYYGSFHDSSNNLS